MLNNLKDDGQNQPAEGSQPEVPAAEMPAPAEQVVEEAAAPPAPDPGEPVQAAPADFTVPTQPTPRPVSLADLSKINYEMLMDVPIKVTVI